VLGRDYPVNLNYAYGTRNRFGIDYELLTRKLWDTKSNPDNGDEASFSNIDFVRVCLFLNLPGEHQE
jgi:glucose/arabinose dehydrogenase